MPVKMMKKQTAEFCLYHTSGCHLCEVAEQMLNSVAGKPGIAFCVIDIADDDSLLELYGIRIPVVCHLPTGRELGWPFDLEQLQQFVMGEMR